MRDSTYGNKKALRDLRLFYSRKTTKCVLLPLYSLVRLNSLSTALVVATSTASAGLEKTVFYSMQKSLILSIGVMI